MKKGLVLMSGVLSLATVALPQHAFGTCARSDVDYYLSQGFTREQVVAICTGAIPIPKRSRAARITDPPQAKPSAEDGAQSRDRGEGDALEAFLVSAIDGYDVRLTPKALHYSRRTCIEYGPYNEYGIKTESCPDVRYTIARMGIEVRGIGPTLFVFGNDEVIVSGTIEREILTLDRYPLSLQTELSGYLERGEDTTIPIRDGIPRERLEAALRALAL